MMKRISWNLMMFSVALALSAVVVAYAHIAA